MIQPHSLSHIANASSKWIRTAKTLLQVVHYQLLSSAADSGNQADCNWNGAAQVGAGCNHAQSPMVHAFSTSKVQLHQEVSVLHHPCRYCSKLETIIPRGIPGDPWGSLGRFYRRRRRRPFWPSNFRRWKLRHRSWGSWASPAQRSSLRRLIGVHRNFPGIEMASSLIYWSWMCEFSSWL